MLVQAALSVGLLIVGSRCKGNEWMLSLGRAASCYFMFFLGCFLRQHAGVVERMNWKVFLPCGIVSLAVLLYCNTLHQSSFVSVYLITNRYPNPLFLAVCSVAGWILLYSAAYFIRKVPGKRFIMWIGKRTRAVMIFHFAAFKLVAARIVSVYHLPAFCMAAHRAAFGVGLQHILGPENSLALLLRVPVGLLFSLRSGIPGIRRFSVLFCGILFFRFRRKKVVDEV